MPRLVECGSGNAECGNTLLQIARCGLRGESISNHRPIDFRGMHSVLCGKKEDVSFQTDELEEDAFENG